MQRTEYLVQDYKIPDQIIEDSFSKFMQIFQEYAFFLFSLFSLLIYLCYRKAATQHQVQPPDPPKATEYKVPEVGVYPGT